ncbi:hypothetical protein FNU76_01615 [Chitinimonas arctica]|uniref:Uncharacterized protein n=1 Tax=Chitinimonas arctica TaxID=2594795 RepID=A0A516SAT0_9NEIS|nr:hypothetical protein [Chitinimonas arctica]QDQ25158.1 hypothetical protein FNU76_01615 [Chitinimonas arctica]
MANPLIGNSAHNALTGGGNDRSTVARSDNSYVFNRGDGQESEATEWFKSWQPILSESPSAPSGC